MRKGEVKNLLDCPYIFGDIVIPKSNNGGIRNG